MTEPMVTEEDREIARRYTCSWEVEYIVSSNRSAARKRWCGHRNGGPRDDRGSNVL